MPFACDYQFRTATAEDEQFLYAVYCSTRPDVVRAQLPPEQTEAFLEMQFRAQSQHYRNTFPNAQYSIVRNGNGVDIGQLYVDERPDETRILDIALLPEKRSQGIGTTLVKSVVENSHSRGKPVRIHVEKNSREIGFYKRLNFVKIGDIPSHDLMECGVPKMTSTDN